MANTYTQIHIHIVFAVKHRHGLILGNWKHELYKYITGIVQNYKHKLLAINGMPDHVHLLIGLNPTHAISELIQHVKGDSSKWINERRFCVGRFQWQEGYGAFSCSKNQVSNVIEYINNQESHHAKFSFVNEYKQLLNDFEISYDDRFVFKSVE